jgi:hypothetical protein
VSVDVAGAWHKLAPSTTYVFSVSAVNSAGKGYGNYRVFKTAAGSPPSIESVSISHLTTSDATLEAQINTQGLETSYEFRMSYTRCRECEDVVYDIHLPSGLLLGSFEAQSVSLDLNSAGVTLKPGFYEYSLSATNAVGNAEGHRQTFEPPEDSAYLHTTTTSPGPQPTTGPGQNIGQSTTTPAATDPASDVLSAKSKVLTNAQKLAKALKVCGRKPKKQRASCKKHAHNKYGKTASKSVGHAAFSGT